VHDFNPGIDQAGVFWTVTGSDRSTHGNVDSAKATMVVDDLELVDAFTIPNALFGGGRPPIPAVASWELHWEGETRRYRVNNATDRFRGRYIESETVTIEWEASNADGFSFHTTPGSSETVFGLLGRERNGTWFD
jgi:hypothetical protein